MHRKAKHLGDCIKAMVIKTFVFISGPLDVDAAEQYIRLKTPIDVRKEGRIEIIKSSKCQKGKKGWWCFQFTLLQQIGICTKFLH